MKYTLLDLTQNILSTMDGEEVNSINDTVESRQVAQVIRTSYYNILTRANLPEHQQIFSLNASTDITQPVLMTRPDNVRRIDTLKYNIISVDTPVDDYEYVTLLPVQQFLDMVQTFNTTDSDVDTFSFNNHTFYYKTDKHPEYATAINDYYVIFDSYDSAVDTTLQTSKTMCVGLVTPTFSLSDTFIPDLDDIQFPLLLSEATSTAFLQMKQISNDVAIRDAKRGWSNLQKSKFLVKPKDFDQFAYFGRK